MKAKPKIAIVSLTSCQGCQVTILDLGEKFLNLTRYFTFKEFPLIEEEPEGDYYDITFIEGSVVKLEQIEVLKKLRKKSKFLVALGNCAALGGIQEMKNYSDQKKILQYVYKYFKTIKLKEVAEIDNFVKVDYTLPGCPINGQEFLDCLYNLLADKPPKIHQRPVCYECQIKNYRCLLAEGSQICFGPWTLGGCQAVCLKSHQACWGCRGFLKEFDREKFFRTLKKIAPEEKIKKLTEIFGLRDSIENGK